MANTKITTNVIADGAITSAKLDTNITISGSITGTLATAAQTNITSVGTLSSLTVSGDATFDTSTLKVDSTNNRVGIGTASPTSDLTVNGTTGLTITGMAGVTNPAIYIPQGGILGDNAGTFEIRNGGGGSSELRLSSRSFHTFYTGGGGDLGTGTERLRIDSSGNIGIGSSSPTQGKVDILDAGDYDAHTGHGLTINSNANNAYTSMYMGADDSVDAAYIQSAGRNTSFTSKKLLLNPNGGNVGIGTSSITTFTGYKTLHFKNTGGNAIALTESDGGVISQTIAKDSGGGQVLIGARSNHPTVICQNDTERMRITSAGTLLVSTTTVSGLSNGTTNYGHSFGGGQQVNATNNDTNLILNMSNGSSNPHVQFRSDGGNTGNISTNGSAVAYNTGSDYRLKENVIPLKDGLERLNKLNPVQFDWIEAQKTDEGFIAHEVQEIVPYVVKGEKDGEEIQSMDYGKLTPLLVKAIQEQQTIIDDLKTRIETLEG